MAAPLALLAEAGKGGMKLDMNTTAQAGGNDAGGVNINPAGINFGEILRPYFEGSEQNGGIGDPTCLGNRYLGISGSDKSITSEINDVMKHPSMIWIGGLLVVGGLLAFKFYKRGR